MFPAGVAGFALLLLRLCAVGTLVMIYGGLRALPLLTLQNLSLCALVILLLIGLATPITCLFVLLVQAASLRLPESSITLDAALHLLLTTSLLMLGPGEYSVDAKLFGRRLILPPPR